MKMRSLPRVLCTLAMTALCHCTISSTSSSSLDTTFGSSGKITVDFSSGEDAAEGVAIQSNGAILAVGRSYNGSNYDFALTRFDSSGNLDTSFDTDGKQTTNFGGNDEAHAVTIQSDGKIVVAGVTTSGSTSQIAVARYKSDGSLDTTFSSDGLVYTLVGSQTDEANAIALDSDGKILVAGSSYNGSKKVFAIVRYTTAGELDTAFGTNGKVTVSLGTEDDVARGIGFQSDGKIVVGGSSETAGKSSFAITRLETDGDLDSATFASSGKVTLHFIASPAPSEDIAYGMQILAGGTILLGGTVNNGTNDFLALARFSSSGVLDTTFGTSGKTTLGYTETDGTAHSIQGRALGLSTNNQPLLAGYVNLDAGFDTALSLFQTDGTKDIGFGTDGIVTTDATSGSQADEAHAIAIQSDGKKVLAGRSFNGSNYDLLVLRYN